MQSCGERRLGKPDVHAPVSVIFVAVMALITACGGGQEISEAPADSPALTAAEEQLEPDSRVEITTGDPVWDV